MSLLAPFDCRHLNTTCCKEVSLQQFQKQSSWDIVSCSKLLDIDAPATTKRPAPEHAAKVHAEGRPSLISTCEGMAGEVRSHRHKQPMPPNMPPCVPTHAFWHNPFCQECRIHAIGCESACRHAAAFLSCRRSRLMQRFSCTKT